MDFFTTWVSGLKVDMWTIGLVFASIVVLPVLYILYRTFRPAKKAPQVTLEESSAPSNDHFQAPPEVGQPTDLPHDEQVSEHSVPSPDTHE